MIIWIRRWNLFKFTLWISWLIYINTQSIWAETYKAESVLKEEGVIWGFDFLSPHEVLYTLREGELFYFNVKNGVKKKLTSPEVIVKGQGGLLDILIHPKDNQNLVYFTFSEEHQNVLTTALARGNFKEGQINNLETLFRAKVKSETPIHFGSRLAIINEHLFMTIGDRGEREYAQNLGYHNGKILRLALDGKAALNNPFADNKEALPEIWTYGHRNPQGIDVDPVTQKLLSCEFGPRGGDELNLILSGLNYGWPIITYGREYYGPQIGVTHKSGMEQPLTYWVPSISPSGMSYYKGDKIPEWRNHLFLANLSSRHLRRLKLDGIKIVEQEQLFKELNERIRQVKTGLDGYLYFSTDSGQLMKVQKVEAKKASTEYALSMQVIKERFTNSKTVKYNYIEGEPNCINGTIISENPSLFTVHCQRGYLKLKVNCPSLKKEDCSVKILKIFRLPYSLPRN